MASCLWSSLTSTHDAVSQSSSDKFFSTFIQFFSVRKTGGLRKKTVQSSSHVTHCIHSWSPVFLFYSQWHLKMVKWLMSGRFINNKCHHCCFFLSLCSNLYSFLNYMLETGVISSSMYTEELKSHNELIFFSTAFLNSVA